MRLYLRDETNRGWGGQEMREGKRGRVNLNLRTSVVSPNSRADGAICRDVSSLPHPLARSTSLSLCHAPRLSAPPPYPQLSAFAISSHSTEDDLMRSWNNYNKKRRGSSQGLYSTMSFVFQSFFHIQLGIFLFWTLDIGHLCR